MLNLIVVNSDINYVQKIIGNISKEISDIKLYNFFLEESNELYDVLENKDIDIIIIDVDDNGKKVLSWLIENQYKQYVKSIILTYKNIQELEHILSKERLTYVFKCIKKSYNLKYLISILKNLSYMKSDNYEESILNIKVERNLKKIGYNLNHIGTQYILESICYLYKNKLENFKLKDIYIKLAKKYNKSANTIKGNMMQSTKSMYNRCSRDLIINYFNYLELVKLPTIKEVITTVVEKI